MIHYHNLEGNSDWASPETIRVLFALKQLQSDIGRLNRETIQFSEQATRYAHEKEHLLDEFQTLNQQYNNWSRSVSNISSLTRRQQIQAQAIKKAIRDNTRLGDNIEDKEQRLYKQANEIIQAWLQNIEAYRELETRLQNLQATSGALKNATNSQWAPILSDKFRTTQEKLDILRAKLGQISFENPNQALYQIVRETINHLDEITDQMIALADLYENKRNRFISEIQNHRSKRNTWADYVNRGYTIAQQGYTAMTIQALGNLVSDANRLARELSDKFEQLSQDAEGLTEILAWSFIQNDKLGSRIQAKQIFLTSLDSTTRNQEDTDSIAEESLEYIEHKKRQVNYSDFRSDVVEILSEIGPVTDTGNRKVSWMHGKTVTAADGSFTFRKDTWWQRSQR